MIMSGDWYSISGFINCVLCSVGFMKLTWFTVKDYYVYCNKLISFIV